MTDATFNITEFGAVGDGQQVNTDAIGAAVRAAVEAGGGTVRIPAGVFMSGSVELFDHITLELCTGAVLKASPTFDDFAVASGNPRGNRHLLYARSARHITIRGEGTIDGNRAAYERGEPKPYTWTSPVSERPRPCLSFDDCEDLRFEGFTIKDSTGWTIRISTSQRIWVRGIRLYNYVYSGNADGIDMSGVSDVVISDCHIETADDAIVFKALKHTCANERVTITNCIIRTSCAAIRLGAETWHNYRQFVISNCVIYKSSRAVDVISRDGAVIEDITVSNLVIDTDSSINMNRAIHFEVRKGRSEWTHGEAEKSLPLEEQQVGVIRNVLLSNIVLRTDGRILLTAADGGYLENFTLRDIQMDFPWIEDPVAVKDLSDSRQSSNFCPEARLARAAVVVMNARNFQLHNLNIRWPDGPPPADFQPKYEQGKLVVDPRTDTGPRPDFHGFWGKNIEGGVLDIPIAKASSPDVEAVFLENCDLIQRE